MDAVLFSPCIKAVEFTCLCGWAGDETELDILTLSGSNLVCCPCCKNDDVRVLNEKEDT